MRISRGLGAVAVGAALAFVTSLALPAAGQPTPTSAPTTTVFGGGEAGGAGTGVTSTTTAPGVSQTTAAIPSSGGGVGAPGKGAVLVLVRRLTWREAAAAVRGRSETIAAGLVSTLPRDASLAARVLSLAAGRQVDARALAGGSDQAAIDRMRAANPDAHFGGLPQVQVVAASGLEATALIGLGPSGGAPPVAPLEVTGPPSPAGGELLVVAVPDAAGLRRVLEQLRAASPLAGGVGGAPAVDATPTPSRFVIVGLESPKGRAQVAPFVALGGAPGMVTSDSTRRRGLIALQDVRPTLAGSAAGTDGSTIRALPVVDPLGSVGRLDRQVASLVAARRWATLLAGVMGTFALAASLLALLLRRRSGRGREVFRRLARALLLLSLALPSGDLVASAVAPLSWPQWLLLGLGASVVLALAAWLAGGRLPRRGGRRRDRPKPPPKEAPATAVAEAEVGAAPSWAAPALLGALVTTLIVVDLLVGGIALSRPLLGNSAFDGERFYGLGNGYFAHALAGVFLVVAFRQLPALTAAALLVGLALLDGLPILGADVGGALTATLTAVAAWLLLRRRRWSRLRVLLVLAAAVVLALAIVFGVVAIGPATHGSRLAHELLGSDPSAALRTVRHQLSRNFALLAGNFWAWWGPILTVFAAVASVRPPRLLAGVPAQVWRAVGVGAIGSLLLIVLNDTGVTAAAGSGLALVATLAWFSLEPSPAPPSSEAPSSEAPSSEAPSSEAPSADVSKPAAGAPKPAAGAPKPAAESAPAAAAAPNPKPAQVGSTPEPVPDEPDKTGEFWKPRGMPASGSAIGQDRDASPNGEQDGSVQRERGVRRDGPGH